ncbi:MAG: tetratricopeptide repeat protein [Anaerolineales bacterium]|nr:MAG: tetratricopeptide repeat protein [Anaerolineales bacterium]
MYCYQCGHSNADSAQIGVACSALLDMNRSDKQGPSIAQLEEELQSARQQIERIRKFVPPIVADGILNDPERLHGTRREVTFLFADAVNFTRLSTSLDAETVFILINDLLTRLVNAIHRYDGLVDKFIGDGLMAVFGAPLAHENDAELAIRAALDMQQAAREFSSIAQAKLGAPISIRIGIHSGIVVAGVLGTDTQTSYTVIGDPVNIASRLESQIEPGHILVGAPVYTRVHALFNFTPPEMISVKGFDQDIEVYKVISSRAVAAKERGVPGIEGLFLGRAGEISILNNVLNTFSQDDRGALVIVEGDAGLGKSRLVGEWLSGVPAKDMTIWHGRGLPYAQGTGYGVFRSLLQDAVNHAPDLEALLDKVSDPFLPYIRNLLGLPLSDEDENTKRYLSPEQINQMYVLAIREWISRSSTVNRLVLVLDDFHWADDPSCEVLKSILNLIHTAPVLFVIITRPQTGDRIRCGDLSGFNPTHVQIPPLSDGESVSLLQNIADLHNVPQTIIDTILVRAEGNPFYIEEFVRMLIEKGVMAFLEGRWRVSSPLALEQLDIPTSLRGMMMTRIDRLPENLRYLVQDAAVIGLQFDSHLLEQMEHRLRGVENIIPMLERLCELDLLIKQPQVSADTYAFRHILTQEAIYHSSLRHQRPKLHRIVAESIEALYKDSLMQYVALLAHHYDFAREREKALLYTLKAGELAQQRFANRESIEYYSRALQLSQHFSGTQEERWRAAIGMGDVQQHVGDYEEAIAFYQAALEEHLDVAAENQSEVMLKTGRVWDKRGVREKAEYWYQAAASKLESLDKDLPRLRAEVNGALGWLEMRKGNLSTAEVLLEKAVALVDGTTNYEVISSSLNRLGGVYFNLGKWDAAVLAVGRALELREKLNDLVGVARSSNNLGILKRTSGDLKGALANYQRSLEAMLRVGDTEGTAIADTNIANVYIDLGAWKLAEENLHRSFAISQRIANPNELAQAHLNLARLYIYQKIWEKAETHLHNAITLFSQSGTDANPNLIDAFWVKGMLNLEKQQLDAAEESLEKCHALLIEVTRNANRESAEWGRYEQLAGRIAFSRDQTPIALQHFQTAAAIFKKTNTMIEEGESTYWCGITMHQTGESAQGINILQTALAIFERLDSQTNVDLVNEKISKLIQMTD